MSNERENPASAGRFNWPACFPTFCNVICVTCVGWMCKQAPVRGDGGRGEDWEAGEPVLWGPMCLQHRRTKKSRVCGRDRYATSSFTGKMERGKKETISPVGVRWGGRSSVDVQGLGPENKPRCISPKEGRILLILRHVYLRNGLREKSKQRKKSPGGQRQKLSVPAYFLRPPPLPPAAGRLSSL